MDRRLVIVVSFLVVVAIVIGYIVINIGFFGEGQVRAKLHVDPQTSMRAVGESFAVNVSVSNVTDFFGWEFRLGWNATVLEVVNVTEGSFLRSGGDTFFTFKVNSTVGFVLADSSLLESDVAGVNGSGTLVTVQFRVKESGKCDLDLYDTYLISSSEQSIVHTIVNGRFSATS